MESVKRDYLRNHDDRMVVVCWVVAIACNLAIRFVPTEQGLWAGILVGWAMCYMIMQISRGR